MTADQEIAASAKRAGHRAALEGLPYAANPFPDSKPHMRLAWSEGHNEGRAIRAQRIERRQMQRQLRA